MTRKPLSSEDEIVLFNIGDWARLDVAPDLNVRIVGIVEHHLDNQQLTISWFHNGSYKEAVVSGWRLRPGRK